MSTAAVITDINQELERDHRYLLYFDLPAIVDTDILRRISDGANLTAQYLNYAGKLADVELLGTTVAENVDGVPGKRQLLAQIRIQGTPLLAAVAPIVAIVLIAAGVYLVIKFQHAIDLTLSNVGETVGKVGDSVQDIADNVGAGVQSLTTDAGTGLKFALPIAAVGASVLLVLYLTSYSKMFRR